MTAKSRPRSAQTETNPTYSGGDELRAIESHLENYSRDVVRLLATPHGNPPDVLEFGAGIGTLARLWEEITGTRPECLEIDPAQREIIEQRGFRCHAGLESVDKEFDVIYTSNVLEHIEDDAAILRALHARLRKGGALAIYVPAFQVLYSHVDAKVGHHRRYGRAELRRKVEDAGFSIERCQYVDSVGFLAWLYLKLKGGSEDDGDSGASMRFYDRYVFPVSRFLDTVGFSRLFGKNLLVHARKA